MQKFLLIFIRSQLSSEWIERCLNESTDSRTSNNRFLLREVDPSQEFLSASIPPCIEQVSCGFLFSRYISTKFPGFAIRFNLRRPDLGSRIYSPQSFLLFSLCSRESRNRRARTFQKHGIATRIMSKRARNVSSLRTSIVQASFMRPTIPHALYRAPL